MQVKHTVPFIPLSWEMPPPSATGFVIILQAQLSGVLNILGWSLVALYGVMAMGYGYLYFKEPAYPVPVPDLS